MATELRPLHRVHGILDEDVAWLCKVLPPLDGKQARALLEFGGVRATVERHGQRLDAGKRDAIVHQIHQIRRRCRASLRG